jgi:hypothetical protein
MSSEKTTILAGTSDIILNACITNVVRKTSPNVPMCGRPDGPYPVSSITSLLPLLSIRLIIFRTSTNGQDFAALKLSFMIQICQIVHLILYHGNGEHERSSETLSAFAIFEDF